MKVLDVAFVGLVLGLTFAGCKKPAAAKVEALLPQHVLYIGHRPADFEPFLRKNFARVATISRAAFSPEQAKDFDVVLLDWPHTGQPFDDHPDATPLGKREDWNKPTVLLGSAGLNLAVSWKIKGGSGCTCLAPVAYDLREHQIFRSPIPIDPKATKSIPTPTPFRSELNTPTILVVPLVNGIRRFHSVINDNERGWATHFYEFSDMPEVEIFSGGINEQTPRSAAFWRQGNLLHFGFEQSPSEMNEVGRAMLVNGIVYISRFTQDRPIDRTSSVFGLKKDYTLSRNRAARYLSEYPKDVTEYFSAGTLASFNWHDEAAAKKWFETARPWLHPNSENVLEIDAEAKSLGTPFDSTEFLQRTIDALRDERTRSIAATLLNRYVFQPPGQSVSPDVWEQWWRENSPYVFYSELGGYRWYIDHLAKSRRIPTKDLRGSARMDAL